MANLSRDERTGTRDDEERRLRIRQVAARVWLGRSADPDIEIDADAQVSIAADGSGAWIQAWLWLDGEHFAKGSP
jgi:hypothetical protein